MTHRGAIRQARSRSAISAGHAENLTSYLLGCSPHYELCDARLTDFGKSVAAAFRCILPRSCFSLRLPSCRWRRRFQRNCGESIVGLGLEKWLAAARSVAPQSVQQCGETGAGGDFRDVTSRIVSSADRTWRHGAFTPHRLSLLRCVLALSPVKLVVAVFSVGDDHVRQVYVGSSNDPVYVLPVHEANIQACLHACVSVHVCIMHSIHAHTCVHAHICACVTHEYLYAFIMHVHTYCNTFHR